MPQERDLKEQGIQTSPKLANDRYGRDRMLQVRSCIMASESELNALRQKPVYRTMTKDYLITAGVLPAPALEENPVASALPGRGEGHGRGAKGGRGKGREEEEDDGSPKKALQASPGQTGGSAAGSRILLMKMNLRREDRIILHFMIVCQRPHRRWNEAN